MQGDRIKAGENLGKFMDILRRRDAGGLGQEIGKGTGQTFITGFYPSG
jgi:hypothetical protein